MIVRNVLVKQAIFHETVNEPTQDDAKYQSFRSFCIPIRPFSRKCIEIRRFVFFFLFFQETCIFDTIKYLFSNERRKNVWTSEMQVWDSLEGVQCLSKFLKTLWILRGILIFSIKMYNYIQFL